ncbi:MAG: LamG domain-containing protein, partial [Planctomycetota bacterium]
NMILRTQMVHLAESGLEHARGLILSPQDVDTEYWQGDVRQQLVAGGNDYYDVNVVKLAECNYQITCTAYREKSGERVGRSGLMAELRLDPVIAFWAGVDMTVWQRITVNGDVYCNGVLTNDGVINGDVFANVLNGSIAGQKKGLVDLSLQWPGVTVGDVTSHYSVQPIGSSLSGVTYGPYNPVRVCYYNSGDVELAGNVQIDGMLVVEGDLIIRGDGNVITAAKNLPALFVTGDLIIESSGILNIDGLAIVEGQVRVSGGAGDVSIVGGLFAGGGMAEAATDSSGNNNVGVLYNGPTWQPFGGQVDGALELDGIDDYVAIAESSDFKFGTGDFSMGAWVKTSATNKSYIIDNYHGAVGEVGCQLVMNADGTVYFEVRGGTLLQITSTVTINNGAWHHIFGSADRDSSMNLYIDGASAATGGTNSDNIDNSNPVLIGVNTWQSDPLGNFFGGIIDDARIYNRALDANDIYPIPSEVGLVGHWKLDGAGCNVTITAAPSRTAIVVWPDGVAKNWGSAVGAFFKSITRE